MTLMTFNDPATNVAEERTPVVLVVEDDLDILRVIKDVLEEEGFVVNTASDGGQALVVAECQPPDLVVLDVSLPVLDGRRVAARLRETRGPSLPILTVTADGGAAEKSREMGAYAYMRKPFELVDLVAVVRRGLGQ